MNPHVERFIKHVLTSIVLTRAEADALKTAIDMRVRER